MEIEETTNHIPNVACTMEIQGMRNFFILIVFAAALFVILTTIGVLTSRSHSIRLSVQEKDRDLHRRNADNDTMVNDIKHLRKSILPTRHADNDTIVNNAKHLPKSLSLTRDANTDTIGNNVKHLPKSTSSTRSLIAMKRKVWNERLKESQHPVFDHKSVETHLHLNAKRYKEPKTINRLNKLL